MNKTDRARLEAILKNADQLLNSGSKDNGILNITVLEAVLADVSAALYGSEPRLVAKLVERENAVDECECPTPKAFHYSGCAVLIAQYNGFTSDGHPIKDGMAVWDYNLEPGYVSFKRLGDDGWFEVIGTGQERGHSMNDVRVCVRHPSSGQLASDALKGRKTK